MGKSRSIAAAALVLGLSGCGGSSETLPDSQPEMAVTPQSLPTESPPAQAALPVTDEPTPIDAGTYRMPRDRWAVTDYSVTIPVGWALQYGHLFNKNADTLEEFGFYAVTVDEIFSDACERDSAPRSVGPGVDALVKALREQPGPIVSDPVETTLGGHRAVRLDLSTPRRWKACPNLEDGIGLRVWFSEPAEKNLLMTLDGVTNVYILELRGGRQVFVTAVRGETTAAERAELRRVLDTIRIPA